MSGGAPTDAFRQYSSRSHQVSARLPPPRPPDRDTDQSASAAAGSAQNTAQTAWPPAIAATGKSGPRPDVRRRTAAPLRSAPADSPRARPAIPLAGVFGRQVGMQRVERRLLIQAVAALSHEPFERLTLRVVRLARLKQRERQLQRRQLQLHHGGVIHPLRGARLGQLLLRRRLLPPALRRIAALEILHRVDVDIRQIQPAARRGAVGLALSGLAGYSAWIGLRPTKAPPRSPPAPPSDADRRNRRCPSCDRNAAYTAERRRPTVSCRSARRPARSSASARRSLGMATAVRPGSASIGDTRRQVAGQRQGLARADAPCRHSPSSRCSAHR